MADVVNLSMARTQFSRLVARAEAGEEIVIARRGRPVALLLPLEGSTVPLIEAAEVLPLPASRSRTVTGEPVPNAVALDRRPRSGH